MLAEAARGRRSCGSKNRVPSRSLYCTRVSRTGGSFFNIDAHQPRAVRHAALVMHDGDDVSAGREPHASVKGGYSGDISDGSFEFVQRRSNFGFFTFNHARVRMWVAPY